MKIIYTKEWVSPSKITTHLFKYFVILPTVSSLSSTFLHYTFRNPLFFSMVLRLCRKSRIEESPQKKTNLYYI